jgi:small subunit ribosomal protein S21
LIPLEKWGSNHYYAPFLHAGEPRVIKVKLRQNESLDALLRRFKKACEKEGLIRDIKRAAFYEKPSQVKRRKERQAIRKAMKEPRRPLPPR